jgi:hypothetical protein
VQTVATVLNINPIGIAGSAAYISTNVMRFMTGSLFGLGVSLWLSPLLADSFDETYHKLMQSNALRSGREQLKIILITLGALFIVYVGFVATWNFTSDTNKPTDWLDSAVKAPATDFYARRQDGVCPTTGTDLFNLNCLLGR